MKKLTGVIKNERRTEVQRVEGLTQSPQFMIDDNVYYVYQMEESYVTSGVKGEHHTLKAVVCITNTKKGDEGLRWYNLDMDYTENTWELTITEEPKEG